MHIRARLTGRTLQLLSISVAICSLPGNLRAQEMQVIANPPLGQENTIPAGGEVYSYVRLYTITGYQLEADTKAGHWLLEEPVKAGTRLVDVPTSKAVKACAPEPNSFTALGPCFIDDDGDGKFDRHSGDQSTMFRKLKPPVSYSETKLTISREDSFKRTILFQGATSDTLRFSYREFKNDMARPAFTEELSILREAMPSMIMLKNLQIEVIGVSGMGLTYRLVQGN